MAKAKNAVIAGDFNGKAVSISGGKVCIGSGFGSQFYVDRDCVESYEVVNDEHQKSVASGIARGVVGGALFGTAGLIAGSATAKSKGIYQIAIQFKSDNPKYITYGKRSLIEVDDKIYKLIVKSCF